MFCARFGKFSSVMSLNIFSVPPSLFRYSDDKNIFLLWSHRSLRLCSVSILYSLFELSKFCGSSLCPQILLSVIPTLIIEPSQGGFFPPC